MTNSGAWRRPAALAVVCVAVRLAAYLATGYQVDDALITFRYAENLAAGNGFVYNLGERVLGTTTPLFTLLLAMFKTLGVATPTAAIALSLAASAVTTTILIRFGESSGLDKLSFLPALLYILYPRCIVSDISGLETAAFTFLLLLSVYTLYLRDYPAASVGASLAAITRPEGVGLVAVVLVVAAIERASRLQRLLIAPLLIIGSWLVFSLGYFGTVLPNSMLAKAALYQQDGKDWMSRLSEMTTLVAPLGALAFAAACGVLIWLIMRRERLALILGIVVGFIAALTLYSPKIFFWYPAPLLPLLFIVFSFALRAGINPIGWRSAPLMLVVACALVLAPLSFAHVKRLSVEMRWYETNHIAAAGYLNIHAQRNDKVMAEDIGHFGYKYRSTIVDRDGLVTPLAVSYNRRGNYIAFVDSVKADWIFLAVAYPSSKSILSAPSFYENYDSVIIESSVENHTHRLFKHR